MWNVVKMLANKAGLKQTKLYNKYVRFRKVWQFDDFYLNTLKTLKHNPSFDFAYLDLDTIEPEMSPNIWEIIKNIIRGYKNPKVLEYGMGTTSYHICKMLLDSEGSYEGIEHNVSWFRIQERWIELLLASKNQDSKITLSTHVSLKNNSSSFPVMNQDVITKNGNFQIKLLLRPVKDFSGDGLIEDFYEYVTAPSDEYDVIIVDGRCRNGTLKWILDKGKIKKSGTLILHDAYKKNYAEGISLFPKGKYIDGKGGYKNPINPEQKPSMFYSKEAFIWVND